MHFERQVRKTRQIPMVPLIDVMFFLLLFFMLSTSFVRTESIELRVPGGGAVQPSLTDTKILQVYLTNDGYIYIGRKPVNEEQLTQTLSATVQRYPDVSILLLSGPQVNVQQLVRVMDNIYLAGGSNLSLSSWEPNVPTPAPVSTQPNPVAAP